MLQTKNPSEIRSSKTNLISNTTLKKDPGNNLENWYLHPLIEVAKDIELIDDNTAIQTRLAKDFRNLIHPGRALRKGQKCNRATTLTALAALEHVIQDLSNYIP